MSDQSIVSALRKLCAAVPSTHVVEYLARKLQPVSWSGKICLEFFSLGDLLKGTIVIAAYREAFPDQVISVRLREEYHDKDGILDTIARQYSAEVNKDSPSDCPTIGIFDTKVAAYRPRTKDYHAVIPAQHLTILHGIGLKNAEQIVRNILEISPDESVLTIGCYTSTKLDLSALDHIKDPQIRRDFSETHAARYISQNALEAVLRATMAHNHFDRVILVPRNISEESSQIQKLKELPFVGSISELCREPLSSRVLLLQAKGVLRAAYAVANVSVVMGYHNVLEPYLCNQKAKTFCFEPPIDAPNRFLFDCGIRHGLLRSIGTTSSTDLDPESFLESIRFDSFDPDPLGFEKDPLFNESLDFTANAMKKALTQDSTP